MTNFNFIQFPRKSYIVSTTGTEVAFTVQCTELPLSLVNYIYETTWRVTLQIRDPTNIVDVMVYKSNVTHYTSFHIKPNNSV
jgi:hypothetical protein